MNVKMTRYIIGKMMGVEGILLFIPMIVGMMYRESSAKYFLVTSVMLLICYVIFGTKRPKNTVIYAKEGLVVVASAWILWSIFGALPLFCPDRYQIT